MRRWILIILGVTLCVCAHSQDDGGMQDVIRFLGTEIEETDSEEVERLFNLIRRPLPLNKASHQTLISSGLFTAYQVASLLDYIHRTGAILSFAELAALDGFGDDFVLRIRPFVTLLAPHVVKDGSIDQELIVRSSYRTGRYSYAARYRLDKGQNLSVSMAASRSLDASRHLPDAFCGYIEWRSRNHPFKLIAGDFNIRFGQGLNLWNGMMINSLTSPSTFMRRMSGVTPSGSFTGNYAYTGVASEFVMRRFALSAALALPGLKRIRYDPQDLRIMPVFNLTYNFSNGHSGISHYIDFSNLSSMEVMIIPSMKTSADMAFCLSGVDLFSEVCYDWVNKSVSAAAGVVFPIGEPVDVGIMLRHNDTDTSMSLSSELNIGRWIQTEGAGTTVRRLSGTLSADAVLYSKPKVDTQDKSIQVKIHTQWKLQASPSFAVRLRFTERLRSWGHKCRTDIRSDMIWNCERFAATMRLNMLKCRSVSFLGYVEGGYLQTPLSIYLRQGVFLIDDWDDRIYVYERDAPGCFNAPAFYGRGLWTSLVISWKYASWGKLYFRSGYTFYPFMQEKKPGKAELRLQCVMDF